MWAFDEMTDGYRWELAGKDRWVMYESFMKS